MAGCDWRDLQTRTHLYGRTAVAFLPFPASGRGSVDAAPRTDPRSLRAAALPGVPACELTPCTPLLLLAQHPPCSALWCAYAPLLRGGPCAVNQRLWLCPQQCTTSLLAPGPPAAVETAAGMQECTRGGSRQPPAWCAHGLVQTIRRAPCLSSLLDPQNSHPLPPLRLL